MTYMGWVLILCFSNSDAAMGRGGGSCVTLAMKDEASCHAALEASKIPNRVCIDTTTGKMMGAYFR